ncbi:MAG TPA: hypothetical protein VMZ52_10855 [Bryobacteraceae bacterium]|nr:hypothetical protein [Bryobacteraceae bacterium]
MADDKQFLADLQNASVDVRFAAWRAAGSVTPAVIPQLGKLASSPNPGVAKAAREALTTMTHGVGKTASTNRTGVEKGLLGLASGDYALPVRFHAFRLLSGIASEESVPAIARWLQNTDLREEAIYCLERIPGPAVDKTLITAYKEAKDDFKPRVLAALGHRRVEDAAGLCAEAMRSTNKDIAVAGVKAFGRIGKKPAGAVTPPEERGLSTWQRIDEIDSLLRFADAQAKQGNAAEAMRIYKTALDRPEEHWQCAAIIGIAKLKSEESAAAILPKMKSSNRTVRITAEKAWKGMAGEATPRS